MHRLAALDRDQRTTLVAVCALFALGVALRLYWNNVTEFSPDDETTYLTNARVLAGHFFSQFPKFASEYATNPERWDTPNPLRWGHWALTSGLCSLPGGCSFRALAWLSTVGGIGALVFTWLLGREFLGQRPALIGVALSLVAPLQLHLGRRALQDELACAATLAVIWAYARALTTDPAQASWRRHALAVAIGTLALAEKETTVLWGPALLALWAVRHRARGWQRRDLLLLLPPVLFVAGFFAVSESVTLFFADAKGNLGAVSQTSYITQYMSGPPYRYLLDLFILAPLVFLLGVAGAGVTALDTADESRGARELVVVLAAGTLVWAVTPKDVRYFAAADSLLRLLAATFLVRVWTHGRRGMQIVAVLLAVNLAVEFALFHRVFVEWGAYDPVTGDILQALDAIPR